MMFSYQGSASHYSKKQDVRLPARLASALKARGFEWMALLLSDFGIRAQAPTDARMEMSLTCIGKGNSTPEQAAQLFKNLVKRLREQYNARLYKANRRA
ncbi:hypothetical protein F6X40_09400 [Paraburkholderia sp. UCT31]|uniref:hypothetical protein n=1 Tax=Paraburkholderia sp. UCT31 TaxID=2615209 RepID=UPI001655AEDB|nr:hypothetical protein [Paraburkholderia sp. UCT31]MBC8737023.1 hypothetical protein [Paraburkholderia sp. UCT31]